MDCYNAKFIVITGGPGAGKSSLLEALACKGYQTMPEAGRAIIQSQRQIGGVALPDGDRLLYAELMLMWELRSYAEAGQYEGPVFFDRGVPDVAGYLKLCGLNAPGHVLRAAQTYRYNGTVFIAPPWREIYVTDDERGQSWAEAQKTYETMLAVYKSLNYEVIALPLAPVARRVDFVLSRLGI